LVVLFVCGGLEMNPGLLVAADAIRRAGACGHGDADGVCLAVAPVDPAPAMAAAWL
jgi:hypothetical protein